MTAFDMSVARAPALGVYDELKSRPLAVYVSVTDDPPALCEGENVAASFNGGLMVG